MGEQAIEFSKLGLLSVILDGENYVYYIAMLLFVYIIFHEIGIKANFIMRVFIVWRNPSF